MKKTLHVSDRWKELAQNKTLIHLLEDVALESPDREALIFGDQRITYSQYWENSRQLAKGLYAMGIRRGDHVGIWMTNRPEWCYCRFGIYQLGAVMIPINTRFGRDDLDYILRQGDIKALITERKFLGKIDAMGMLRTLVPELDNSKPGEVHSDTYPLLRNVVCLNGTQPGCFSWSELMQLAKNISDQDIETELKPEDLIHIIFTSGTTGFPKGVMSSNIGQVGYSTITAEGFKLSEGSRLLDVVPLFGNIGLGLMSFALVAGATLVMMNRFDPLDAIKLIEKEKITHGHFVPTMLRDILSHPDMDKYDFSSLKYIKSGGAYAPSALIREARERIGALINNGYGLVEASGLSTWVPMGDTDEHVEKTIGLAMPNCEVVIRDPKSDRELPPETEGEICIKEMFPGSCHMKGYYKKPELTAVTIVNGWLHTGDLGMTDEEGYFRITGRVKEMFSVGGFNVSPPEVEEFLLKNPKIEAVSVVGVPEERLGEIGAAFIRLKKGQTATEEEIRTFCKDRIANIKVPRYVFFVEEFPLNPQGKVQKFKQREWAVKKLGLKEIR